MDFMKVLDQTVREIKREVNLKVLKVPEIEQKVLDATSDEPWGPHGSALAEISQATKKFTECNMIMNVLWTRLTDTAANWRHVYKALAVIEYLVANGSERAVGDILEHSFRISSLSGFEYVEPNGKDVGMNVRKKVETILALLNDKDKLQAVRNKAAANRDKYFGLSSTGITYKSGSASYGGSSFQHNVAYGSLTGANEYENFRVGDRDKDRNEDEIDRNNSRKDVHSRLRGHTSMNEGTKLKKETARLSRDKDRNEDEIDRNNSRKNVHRRLRGHTSMNEGTKLKKETARLSRNSLQSNETKSSAKHDPLPTPQGLNAQMQTNDGEFDDFDPRGSSTSEFDDFDPRRSSTSESVATGSKQVDLFGDNLIGGLMDAPTSSSTETTSNTGSAHEVDLFGDAAFVSASPHAEASTGSSMQGQIDLFADQPSVPASFSSVDLFCKPDSSISMETKSPQSTNTSSFDPFAATDLFGAFTSHSGLGSAECLRNSGNENLSASSISAETKSPQSTNTSAFDPFAATPHSTPESSDHFGASSDSAIPEPLHKSGIDNLRNLNQSTLMSSKPAPMGNFQVKSGIWADSLNRGLVDLNLTASKKVSLSDIGIVGGLSDGFDEKEKRPPASIYMGRAMGTGSSLGKSGCPSSTATGGSRNSLNLG